MLLFGLWVGLSANGDCTIVTWVTLSVLVDGKGDSRGRGRVGLVGGAGRLMI